FAEMLGLKSYLLATKKLSKKASVNSLPSKGRLTQDVNDSSNDDDDDSFQLQPEDIAGLSDDEVEELKREKRRAYARAYYHKKKSERETVNTKSSKRFKTTPEQRAYQRTYYQRKKAEKLAYD